MEGVQGKYGEAIGGLEPLKIQSPPQPLPLPLLLLLRLLLKLPLQLLQLPLKLQLKKSELVLNKSELVYTSLNLTTLHKRLTTRSKPTRTQNHTKARMDLLRHQACCQKKGPNMIQKFLLINCSLFLLVKYPCALVKKRKLALVEKKKKSARIKMFQYVIQLTENCVLIHVQSKSLLCSDSMFYCLSKL